MTATNTTVNEVLRTFDLKIKVNYLRDYEEFRKSVGIWRFEVLFYTQKPSN